MRITNDPYNYEIPSEHNIQRYLKKIKCDTNLPIELVEDFCSYYWDGESSIKTEEDFIKTSTQELSQEEQENLIINYNKLKDLLQNGDLSIFNGSPMQKSIQYLKILIDEYNQKNKYSDYYEEGDDSNYEFLDNIENAEDCNKKVKAAVKKFEDNLEDFDDEMLDLAQISNEIEPDTKDSINTGLRKRSMIVSLSKEQSDFISSLSLIESYSNRIGASRSVKKIIDDTSKTQRYALMDRYSQVFKTNTLNLVMPGFTKKLLQKQLLVRRGHKTIAEKQCLIFLVDNSGSMNNDSKISIVKALLFDRINQVKKEKAILYINTFVCDAHHRWIKLETFDECEKLWKSFDNYFSFNGGGTDIEKSIKTTIDCLKNGKLPTENGNSIIIEGDRPQIVVVNDGEDIINPHYKPSVITNGFILKGKNNKMKQMCINSGGIYKEF